MIRERITQFVERMSVAVHDLADGRSEGQALWQRAAVGIGWVTLAALSAVFVGFLMAVVVSWLY